MLCRRVSGICIYPGDLRQPVFDLLLELPIAQSASQQSR